MPSHYPLIPTLSPGYEGEGDALNAARFAMTNDSNARLADAIAAMSRRYPDWRFGQIVANIASFAHANDSGAVWELTADEFVAAVDAHLARAVSTAREHPLSA